MDPSVADSLRFLELSRFWVQRVLVPILVLIGAAGNIVTVMVLTRRRMRCSTNIYLTALAVTDLIYLFFVLILSFEHYPNINDIRYELYWRFYGINHWFADAASSTSIWLTVSFTVERYIAVCHPIRGKVLCTEKRAKRVIAAVVIICILATASTSFEYQLTTSHHCVQRHCPNEDGPTTTINIVKENVTEYSIPNSTNIENVTDIIFTSTDTDLENVIKSGPDFTGPVSTEPTDLGEVVSSYSDWQELEVRWNDTYATENLISDNLVKQKNSLSLLQEFEPKSNKTCDNSTLDTGLNNTDCFRINLNTTIEEYDNLTNCCVKKVTIRTEPTTLGTNATYRTIFYWFSSVSFAFLPLILIATINCFLVNAVRKSQKERKKMTKSQENSSQNQENRMTVILISVVILFLICQSPTACMLIYTSVYPSDDAYTENILRGLGNLFNLLVSINAACNFLLYCALSDKYRRTFKALFCEKKLNRQDTFAISGKFAARFSSTRNGAACKRNASAYVSRNTETSSLSSIPRARSMMSRPSSRKGNLKV